MSLKTSYKLNSVELIREALKQCDLTLEEENVEGTSIENGGFPLSNMSTDQLCRFYAMRCNPTNTG